MAAGSSEVRENDSRSSCKASAEHSSGASQVGQTVRQMDQVTQHNAALVEQGVATADSLKLHARELRRAVAVFKVGTADAPASRFAHA